MSSTNTVTTDILIIGGGPSGAVDARHFAADRRHELYFRARFINHQRIARPDAVARANNRFRRKPDIMVGNNRINA